MVTWGLCLCGVENDFIVDLGVKQRLRGLIMLEGAGSL
jgi:hypothetical protein